MMKNFLLFAFVFIAFTQFSFAQSGDLMIKSSDKGLYLDHKVVAKENFYSIGRLYNASPKEIAAFNALDMEKGLGLGQVIRIPLSAANFSQTSNKGIPVYYKLGEKESLVKVSNTNNKVSLDNLRRWNKLVNDNVSAGNKLIVGFIVSGQIPVVKQETEKIKQQKEPAVIDKKEPEKIKEKEPIVEKKTTAKTEEKDDKLASPKTQVNTVAMDNVINSDLPGQGYFKASFDQQVKVSPISKNETVTASIFKTANGWRDAKYYLLIDGVQPGTILKIINPANNKAVYAKVLGEMGGIRLNAGLNIRISNSAAAALEINETDKFIVKVNY